MSEDLSVRIDALEAGQIALSQDLANLISVLLHNEIIFVNKNEDGTVTYKLNSKDA